MATNKQKALAKELVENSSQTMAEAMVKVGYSEATATHPSQITESKGFVELLEKYLPDNKLLAKHDEALEATKQLSARSGKDANAESDDFIEVPDYQTRLKAVELGYKVKGRLKDAPQSLTQINVDKGNAITFVNFKDEEAE